MDTKTELVIAKAAKLLNKALNPKKIILFGSHARNEATATSDLDFLLVMENGTNRRKTAAFAYSVLGTIGIPKDIVVATEEDLQNTTQYDGTVLSPALAEGKVLYENKD
jgi:predicted nucleotidyltransferase